MKYNYNSISFIYTINKQCRQASGHDQEDQKGHNEHFPFMWKTQWESSAKCTVNIFNKEDEMR